VAPPTVKNILDVLDEAAGAAHVPGQKRKRDANGMLWSRLCRTLSNLRDISTDPEMIVGIRKCAPPVLKPKDVMDRLLRLDAIVNPGLTRTEFLALFAQCNGCKMVMTQRAFQSHGCILPEVVDLTGGDDE
jgi:hypothetical protein